MPFSATDFTALRYRSFRLLWLGQLVSMTGSMMQSAAVLWHVSLLAPPDEKGLWLGLVGLVRVVPIVFFSLVGGVVADALDRRRLMVVTQLWMTAAAGLLAWLTLGGLEVLWPIYLLTAAGAAGGAFDAPARQALLPNLVPREHLPNAISLTTMNFQLASVAGPALAGIGIGWLGVGAVYAINAVSFVAVLLALLLMGQVEDRPAGGRSQVSLGAAAEGLRFVFGNPLIRSTMLLDFAATFFSSAMALLPIFAQDILRVGPRGYGWLYAAPALGALVASLVMVRAVERIERRGRAVLWAVAVYGAATVAFGLSTSFALTFACLAVTGAADTVSMVIRNIIRQLATPDALRGRMTSVNMVFFMGGPQLGELEAGLVASWLGAPASVVIGGAGCLAWTGFTALGSPALRRYRRDDPLIPAARPPATPGSGA